MLSRLFSRYHEVFAKKINDLEHGLAAISPLCYQGTITSATGVMVFAIFPEVKIGDLCVIKVPGTEVKLYAEVVAINANDAIKLLPFGTISNLSKSAIIAKVSSHFTINLNQQILGKIVDGLGNVLGNLTATSVLPLTGMTKAYPLMRFAPDPLNRMIIQEQFITGVKTIDLFISCGKGQRLAILAGPGMGKTTLMGMIIKNSMVDVIVVALVGERGREVREFIDLELDAAARKKCVLVVVTSDRPPVEQVKSAYTAQTIAEYFRDQGLDVLLFIDSITRFARAQREVGLSAGEPITRGGFPPSVFQAFPQLLERAGTNQIGSITAFYTVLMETEQAALDPIADEIKAIVDGHIILSHKLVELGHFPAINILSSLSRVADRLISSKHKQAVRKIQMLLSKYHELEFLVRVGEYKRGNDLIADEAIDKYPQIMKFLQQRVHETEPLEHSLNQLIKLAGKLSEL